MEPSSRAVLKAQSINARVNRLRARVEQLGARDAATRPILDIIKGLLDLLDDEL